MRKLSLAVLLCMVGCGQKSAMGVKSFRNFNKTANIARKIVSHTKRPIKIERVIRDRLVKKDYLIHNLNTYSYIANGQKAKILKPDSTEGELISVYRELAKNYHPDKLPEDLSAESNEVMGYITEIYKELRWILRNDEIVVDGVAVNVKRGK